MNAKYNSYKGTIDFNHLVWFIPQQFNKLSIKIHKNEKLNSTYWKEFTQMTASLPILRKHDLSRKHEIMKTPRLNVPDFSGIQQGKRRIGDSIRRDFLDADPPASPERAHARDGGLLERFYLNHFSLRTLCLK